MSKLRFFALIAYALMIFPLLSGCMLGNMTAKPKTVEDDGMKAEESSSEPVEKDDGTPDYTIVKPQQTETDEEEADELEPEPEPDPEPVVQEENDPLIDRANEIIAGMTGDELIYQLFVTTPEQITGVETVTTAGEASRAALEKYPVAGLCYRKDNIISTEQVMVMTRNVKSYAKYGLLLCIDEEGGRVRRLSDIVETAINPMFEYKDMGKDTAFENAMTIGKYMIGLGFNTDLAPVADVWTNSENTVIGDRAYSDDFAQAAELITGAVSGFKSSGVITTLKHFPGHGATSEDSHEQIAVLDKSLDELMREEFLPFSAGIEAGSDMVMLGHIMLPQVDSENITTFSYEIVTNILRGRLGYDGVIITDSMAMGAVAEIDSGEAAVRAIKAGADLILEPKDFTAAVEGIGNAITTGELDYERIIESVRRVLVMKLRNGVIA